MAPQCLSIITTAQTAINTGRMFGNVSLMTIVPAAAFAMSAQRKAATSMKAIAPINIAPTGTDK